ncbi:MAG: GAF domain-containing protein [Proteobacteria bacterium]|nr:GAF domain-containing protein [Pseudomonadota bacterium]
MTANAARPGNIRADEEIVDISPSQTSSRQRRQVLIRMGVPILALALVIAAILGIALYSHHANRQGALALSDDLLATLDAQIAQRVSAFLDPCARTLRIMTEIAAKTPPSERGSVAERFAGSVLDEIPQMAAFYFGDDDGNFLMMRRDKNGTETKEIMNAADARRVILTFHDTNGRLLSQREDPADTFDPRTRPWYKGALASDGIHWTGVYIFFTDKKPGITVSDRVKDTDGRQRVFGVDITLEQLSQFLSSLEIGATGRAIIIDNDGRLIAVPDAENMLHPTGDDFVPPRLDEIGDPVLTGAYDRFRVEGQGKRVIDIDGVRYVTSVSPLKGDGRQWWVMIVVPEEDFTGFVMSNSRKGLAMSLVIVLSVAALAGLLVFQGLKSDRAVRRLMAESGTISHYGAIYAEITHQTSLSDKADHLFPPILTESIVEVARAARASIWHAGPDFLTLRCDDSFERAGRGHAGGFQLHQREVPTFFAALRAGDEVDVADAGMDARTQQFHGMIMRPLGTKSLIVLPLRNHAGTVGVICIENAKPQPGTRAFLRTVAGIAALRLDDLDEAAAEDRIPTEIRGARAASPTRLAVADLGEPDVLPANLATARYRQVAAMMLQLTDPSMLATGDSATGNCVLDNVVQLVREEAARHGITYLKLAGQQIVAATGYEGDAEDAMPRMAAFAIALRESCSEIFDDLSRKRQGQRLDFFIGLDFGNCFGGNLGSDQPAASESFDQRPFNLWGGCIETAGIMANSAPPAGIQASEAAYAGLRLDFLFRPRGSFYQPGVGDARTYVLAGQL